jgi:hypothetical protein
VNICCLPTSSQEKEADCINEAEAIASIPKLLVPTIPSAPHLPVFPRSSPASWHFSAARNHSSSPELENLIKVNDESETRNSKFRPQVDSTTAASFFQLSEHRPSCNPLIEFIQSKRKGNALRE